MCVYFSPCRFSCGGWWAVEAAPTLGAQEKRFRSMLGEALATMALPSARAFEEAEGEPA